MRIIGVLLRRFRCDDSGGRECFVCHYILRYFCYDYDCTLYIYSICICMYTIDLELGLYVT